MSKEKFVTRHIGPNEAEVQLMLEKLGVSTLDELIEQTVPQSIRLKEGLKLDEAISEREYLEKIHAIASKNKIYTSYIGLGYYDTITPAVILRNIFENPVWYTSYTPYQAEISQGRLEALLNYQTMVSELTGMQLANSSLLDEATSAAEAMIMMFNARPRAMAKAGANKVFIDENIFPQTLDVLITRSKPLGIELVIGKYNEYEFDAKTFGALVQYPNCDGNIVDYKEFAEKAHANNCLVTVAADLMSLAILTPPAEWGADVAVGTTQRFGAPMGCGGPHAAYFATSEKFKRNLPGRIIGVTKDSHDNLALRMALQTREQHIKREKATSNICTAQALLATMAGMYGVYHGAEGLKRIANDIHASAGFVAQELDLMGYVQQNGNFFDTLKVELPENVDIKEIEKLALERNINLFYINEKTVGISTDETTTVKDINTLLEVFAIAAKQTPKTITELEEKQYFASGFARKSEFMTQNVFNSYHSETEMMRYIKKLERKDISLTHSMISLGSCTMKLNAAVEMLPLSWMEFGAIHPFAPKNQMEGYRELFDDLCKDLSEITGFADTSLQPNSGASGEYAGLIVIKAYLEHKGEEHRNVVIIPASAHGTNPASAAMAGMKIDIVKCDEAGNIDIEDLKAKAEKHKDDLAAIMITYPSTHGVFEEGVIEMCNIVHEFGGQVYMDGANMNAQVGLTNPGLIGADVCHLNLHKTFAMPHGGGGPGVGSIGVATHLVDFLPQHSVVDTEKKGISAVSAAPWGSAAITPITYGYIKMLGNEGLTKSTKIAILNANYIAASLKDYYDILYTGANDRVAHEMILECRNFKPEAGITESDIAKRLMDYGFHAPTLSFPVHGTLMVEPTESESKKELDRFIEAMISIHNEITEIKDEKADAEDNVLKNAPHTVHEITADEWKHSYSRQKAAYPLEWIRENKFWLPVGRVNDAYGDRNLVCHCTPLQEIAE